MDGVKEIDAFLDFNESAAERLAHGRTVATALDRTDRLAPTNGIRFIQDNRVDDLDGEDGIGRRL